MSSRLLRWFVAPPEEGEAGVAPAPAGRAPVVDLVPTRRRSRPPLVAGSAAVRTARPVFAPPRARDATVAASAVDGQSSDGNIVVLGAPGEIDVIAGGAAATLRRLGNPSVVLVWSPGWEEDGLVSPPGFPAAGRWVRRLQAQGLTATAVGAVARVRLADEPTEALQDVRRVQAVAGGPVVVALTRRDAALDALLVEAAWVGVLSLWDAGMTSLVAEQAATLNARTIVLDRPASPGLRIALRLGLRALALSPRTAGAMESPVQVAE